jgi:hypothetical protein
MTDTTSYANVRRFLRQEQRPPPEVVRLEPLIDYFRYEGREPELGPVDIAGRISEKSR